MTAPKSLVVEPLGPEHERAVFSCGEAVLDQYLKQRAGQDVRRRIARVFVCTGSDPRTILGFYTLSALSVDVGLLPRTLARRLPKQPVPAALLGRLAVSRDAHGQGIGRLLLADAVKRAMSAGATIGIHALVVDAKADRAKGFYERFGLNVLPDRPERLFLPLGLPAQ
ncbi:GNAT family N-acetyltransferase [Thiocapsa rosea]|uniref:Acetyltransferase (GNAT) family protein n=1 Tax=Thiocapsa rosea TaxID=69360 RepID=A0A495VFT5_9GAMM|nr:GNAT family N-acetyltransferase [Thiocapsa rosea]RKT47700.1 acetyltransferase (GNAT) family protein [Thiocapsa rosea]